MIDDKKTPFYSEFFDRARNNYFILYLLVAHQRLALERFSIFSSRLPYLSSVLPNNIKYIKFQVERMRQETFDFTLHHRFVSVRTITMYQQVYEKLKEFFLILKLHKELLLKEKLTMLFGKTNIVILRSNLKIPFNEPPLF